MKRSLAISVAMRLSFQNISKLLGRIEMKKLVLIFALIFSLAGCLEDTKKEHNYNDLPPEPSYRPRHDIPLEP